MKLYRCIPLLLVMHSPAFAGKVALTTEATLPDYLTYAALHNPGLEASFNEWKAAVERIDQADSLADPTLSFAYFVEEVETRVGPQQNKIGLVQMFPWFGTLGLKGDVATEAAKASYETYQAAKFRLFYEVKKSYYEYYFLHRAIEITQNNMALLENFEAVARSKYRSGAPQSAMLKAQVELGKLGDRLQTLKEMREPLSAMLNTALNRPHDDTLPWPNQPPLTGATLQEEALFVQLAELNPELRAMAALVQKEQRAVALAHKARYPNFSLGVDYITTDEALNPTMEDSGKDPVIAMVALNIPLWRGKIKAGIEEARRRQDAAALQREQKSHVLAAQLKMALFRYRDAERKSSLYGQILITQAEQALQVTEETYRAGSGDFLDLIDAERLLLEFQLAHERALTDREIALAEIEQLIGSPLDHITHAEQEPSHENE